MFVEILYKNVAEHIKLIKIMTRQSQVFWMSPGWQRLENLIVTEKLKEKKKKKSVGGQMKNILMAGQVALEREGSWTDWNTKECAE